MKYRKLQVQKDSTKITLMFYKKIRLYKKNFNSNVLSLVYNEDSDSGANIDVYKGSEKIKTIYSIYPCVSDQSYSINKFVVDNISFCVLTPTDVLHYELIKFCDLYGIDLIILFCDFKKSYMNFYLDFLDRTMQSNFLLIDKNKFSFALKCKFFSKKNKLELKNKDNFIFCNPKFYNYIFKLLKK